ncbi:MAG: AmmeMemoRadiSam system protein B, partial [bacterium]
FQSSDSTSTSDYQGLLMPHIDYRRGATTYDRLLPHLNNVLEYDRVIILGISHYPCEVPFSPTDKTFQTPFGNVQADQNAYDQFKDILPYNPNRGEWSHRTEHSIEIPLHLLKYLDPDSNFQIFPMLCSFTAVSIDPSLLNNVINALGNMTGDNTFLISAVDFAHLGPKHGDRETLTEQDHGAMEQQDRRMFEHIKQASPSKFDEHITLDDNARRVCGYPAIRTTLPLFDQAEILDYDYWDDPRDTVSYGAALLYS